MSTLYNYIYSYFYDIPVVEIKEEAIVDDFVKIGFITMKDLKSVLLQPVKDIVPNPPPSFSKVDLRNLNQAQLNCILNVKLKPTPQVEKLKNYEVRHPCLRELLKKRNIIV